MGMKSEMMVLVSVSHLKAEATSRGCPVTPDGSSPGTPSTGRARRGSLMEGGHEMDSEGVGFAQERTEHTLAGGQGGRRAGGISKKSMEAGSSGSAWGQRVRSQRVWSRSQEWEGCRRAKLVPEGDRQ